MKASEVLRKAKDHISDPAMWWKGEYSPEGWDGATRGMPCCAEGAVIYVVKEIPDDEWDFHRVYSSLNKASGRSGAASFVKFNDEPATTHADIMALYDRAINLAETEEQS